MALAQHRRLFLAILAGGASRRACRGDGSPPKQFRETAGRMLFMHGLCELVQAPDVAHVVLVAPEAWHLIVNQTMLAAKLPVPFTLAPAGIHRTASAWHALQGLAALPNSQRPAPQDLVAVHDAARPFASRYLLSRLAQAAAREGAAIPAVPVSDSIVQLAPNEGARTLGSYLERHHLVAVQTPQVARWEELQKAHAWAAAADASFTDDGNLLAERGLFPAIVMGEAGNWKITTEQDWQQAEAVLRSAAPA